MTENKRISEWLIRIANEAHELNVLFTNGQLSHKELLDAIHQNYEVLSVMTKVASGIAYMRGISPPKGL